MFETGFKFETDVCNGFHKVLLVSMNLRSFTILNNLTLIIVVFLKKVAQVRSLGY